jgi:hypothetical protein
MRRRAAALLIAMLAAGELSAGDAPPPTKDAVEIKLAAKVGDVFRFRATESSRADVNGKPYSGEDDSRDYSVTVKAVRPDGGFDVEVSFEQIGYRTLDVETGVWTEIETTKASPVGADMRTQMLDAVSRAMIGRAFDVTLDAHGTPLAVAGVREALAAGLKGSPEGEKLPLNEIYDDEKCMDVARSLFLTTPTGAHTVGVTWTEDVRAGAGGFDHDFSVESTLSAATADDATVTSKFSWKPKAKETVGRTRVTGGGDSTTKFARKDGFVLSMKRHLEANPETATRKATSHTDMTVERLPPAAAKPSEPKTPADPPPAKK